MPETMNLLEENTEKKLVEASQTLSDLTRRHKQQKRKRTGGTAPATELLPAKEAANKTKKQHTQREKTFASHTSDKGLTS